MSSALDPQGSSQPPLEQAYKTPGNPADSEPAEKSEANQQRQDGSAGVSKRVPQEQSTDQSQATDSSLARGIRGGGPGEGDNYKGDNQGLDSLGKSELEGEQMRAPGEGEISSAVDRKPGATGGQEGMETDLDRKKAEQAPQREAVKEQRKEDVDVGGVLGQRGGPANPVDSGNYPNSGN